jgi:hypothetical protein
MDTTSRKCCLVDSRGGGKGESASYETWQQLSHMSKLKYNRLISWSWPIIHDRNVFNGGGQFFVFFFLFLGFTFPVSTARQFPFRLQNGGRSHTTAITITRVRQLEEIIIVIMNGRPTFFALNQQDTFSSFFLSVFLPFSFPFLSYPFGISRERREGRERASV